MSHHILLVLHLLAATIWVGGHTYLVLRVFPKALKQKDTQLLLTFEKSYEPIGMGALIVLIITGGWMAHQYGIGLSDVFSFSNPIERVISLKLLLLVATVGFAISAQTRVIPALKHSPTKLPEMALHAVSVTLLAIGMLVLGTFVRYGGISL